MKGTLYIVSTPIGNLEDITARALRILGEVDVIAAEDTRHSLKLLNHYGISKPMISYWKEKERSKAEEDCPATSIRSVSCPYLRCRDTRHIRPRCNSHKNGDRREDTRSLNPWPVGMYSCIIPVRASD